LPGLAAVGGAVEVVAFADLAHDGIWPVVASVRVTVTSSPPWKGLKDRPVSVTVQLAPTPVLRRLSSSKDFSMPAPQTAH
jgi:hypothetical protein